MYYLSVPLSYSPFPALNVEQLSAAIDSLTQVVGALSVQVGEIMVKHLTLNLMICSSCTYVCMYITDC